MSKSSFPGTIGAIVLLAIFLSGVSAQEYPEASEISSEVPRTTAYTREQLDQMVAPIALYSDPLVAQILIAATYPLEVADAARWLQDPDNAALHGDQLATALQDQMWDPSVKALVALPKILQMMASNLQWAEQLGDAFIGQQAEVMDAVQRLRQRAVAAGTLRSTPPQAVTTQDGIVTIEPTNPDVLYVPDYNPTYVYGEWPYPDYPPTYFTPGYVSGGPLIDLGVGIFIDRDFFFFNHPDFRHHRIDIDDHRFRSLNGGHPPLRSGIWTFDSAHRHGVPHHDAALRGSAVPASQRPFRGFNENQSISTPQPRSANVVPGPQSAPVRAPVTAPPPAPQFAPLRSPGQNRSFGNLGGAPVPQAGIRRPAAPVFESHTGNFDARIQSARGQSSRSERAFSGENRGFGGERQGGGGGKSTGGENRSFGGGRGHR